MSITNLWVPNPNQIVLSLLVLGVLYAAFKGLRGSKQPPHSEITSLMKEVREEMNSLQRDMALLDRHLETSFAQEQVVRLSYQGGVLRIRPVLPQEEGEEEPPKGEVIDGYAERVAPHSPAQTDKNALTVQNVDSRLHM